MGEDNGNFIRIKYENYLNYLKQEKLLEVSEYSNKSMMLKWKCWKI